MKIRRKTYELKLPILTMEEAVLIAGNWLITIGEPVEIDQDLIELTINGEPFMLPSPVDGRLISIEVEPEEQVEPGQVLAIIELD